MKFTSRCVPLNRSHIDTDQIIPARFLKGTVKAGLGKHLFNDWRYLPNSETPDPGFALNQPQYQGARVLVAAHNFGCGSSREHAPWALKDYGFQAVLAVSFADIFKNNATKNHVLPIALPESVILPWLAQVEGDPTLEVAVDLAEQTVTFPDGAVHRFEINPFAKQCILDGVDDIGYSLQHLDKIEAYEAERQQEELQGFGFSYLTPQFAS